MQELGQWQARTLFCLNNTFGLNRLLLHFFSPITNKYSKTSIQQLNLVKTHESFGPKYEWSRCFLRECRRQLFGIESGVRCHYIGSFRHNQVVKFYESSAIKANRQHFRVFWTALSPHLFSKEIIRALFLQLRKWRGIVHTSPTWESQSAYVKWNCVQGEKYTNN